MKRPLILSGLFIVVVLTISLITAFPCAHEARVGDLARSSPARRLGFLPLDVVTSVEGAPISSWEDLQSRFSALAGRKVIVTVARGGRDEPLTLAFEMPQGGWREIELSPHWERPVIALTAGSALSRYGAQSGDEVAQVEDMKIVSLQQLRDRLQEHPGDQPLNLILTRGDERLSLGVAPVGGPYGFDTLGVESAAAVVESVDKGGLGQRLGLKPGDRVILLQGQAARDGVNQSRFLANVRAEEKLRATVVRGDRMEMLETQVSGTELNPKMEGEGLGAALKALRVRSAQRLSRGHHISGLCWCSW